MKTVIGVMGASQASETDCAHAALLGKYIAENGWVTLSGGGNTGVMDAVSKGAKDAGGLVVGILQGSDTGKASEHIDLAIMTGMGMGRNAINIYSSTVVVVCGELSPGTLSEVSLALVAQKDVILLNTTSKLGEEIKNFNPDRIHPCKTPEEAVQIIKSLLI